MNRLAILLVAALLSCSSAPPGPCRHKAFAAEDRDAVRCGAGYQLVEHLDGTIFDCCPVEGGR